VATKVGWKVKHKSLKDAWSNKISLLGFRLLSIRTDMLCAPLRELMSRKCKTHTYTHKGLASWGGDTSTPGESPRDGKMIIFTKNCDFLLSTNFKLLRQNKEHFANDFEFLNFIISAKGGHCDYST
jgi:hypothetical protein